MCILLPAARSAHAHVWRTPRVHTHNLFELYRDALPCARHCLAVRRLLEHGDTRLGARACRTACLLAVPHLGAIAVLLPLCAWHGARSCTRRRPELHQADTLKPRWLRGRSACHFLMCRCLFSSLSASPCTCALRNTLALQARQTLRGWSMQSRSARWRVPRPTHGAGCH